MKKAFLTHKIFCLDTILVDYKMPKYIEQCVKCLNYNLN